MQETKDQKSNEGQTERRSDRFRRKNKSMKITHR